MAFQDPELRVCLNSNFSDKHHSRIESLSVKEGYLDNLHIDFSEHLNAIIGGRGTGKSTLLECIRYALELEPIGEKAKSQHEGIIDENIGKSKGCIELLVRSSKMRGKKYIITRYYEEEASVKDEAGNTSRFEIKDILPKIEIYGKAADINRTLDDQACAVASQKGSSQIQTPKWWTSRYPWLGGHTRGPS